MKGNIVFITLVLVLYCALTVVFTALPRSSWSELEKRDLTEFPRFCTDSLASGAFTNGVSIWFSDTEPFRDVFSTGSHYFKGIQKLKLGGEEQVSFIAVKTDDEASVYGIPSDEAKAEVEDDSDIYVPGEDDEGKVASHGIIIAGSGNNVRAMMSFRASEKSGGRFAKAANLYKKTFGDRVNVYCMVIPTSVEFYCPAKVRDKVKPERPVMENIFSQLDSNVIAIDIYDALKNHTGQNIYLRTDHHWSPLGAYYAARELARAANVPFMDLSHYEKHQVPGYVGSMYRYTQDISVKNSPETFEWYSPKDAEYSTSYIIYYLDKDFKITGESKSVQSEFFVRSCTTEGNPNAYCVFMGSDARITRVKTNAANGRRLLLTKDSFGNAIPGWLFYSFEEIHVVDFRYFTRNMVNYVNENGITDIVLSNNITHAAGGVSASAYIRFLTQ